jgi:hypothetical protein
MTHALKTWPEFYAPIASGLKTFELRKDDRPFTLGDTVLLQEYNPETEQYTGKELKFEIGFILRDAVKMGLKPGFCILGLISKEALQGAKPPKE